MKKFLVGAGVLGLSMLAAVSCAKKEEPVAAKPVAPVETTVKVVKESERSRHFLAVHQQLELGGTLYGYADVDGDVLKVAGIFGEVVKQMPVAQNPQLAVLKQDYAALFATLGLTDIKAVGFSSVPDGTGFFRNRAFLYTGGERRGLLAGLGGKPGPFANLKLAPANTDMYFESEIDLPAIYATMREVTAKMGGEQAAETMEAQLKRAGEQAAFSLYSFIQGLKGRATVVLRFDPQNDLRLPGPPGQSMVLPGFSLAVCLDGVAAAVEPTLAKAPMLKVRTEGTARIYELTQPVPLKGLQPVIAIDGTSVYFATTAEFLQECRAGGAGGLAGQADFKQALAQVGAEGNGLGYFSPRFFDQVRRFESLNEQVLPPESRQGFAMIMRMLPKTDRPLVTVRRNLPDGILVDAYWNRSLKQDVAMVMVYNPVTVGVMAAMAIPAFQKVRASSQEKAVMNNLRQLAAAADQYYLETGKSTATYVDLVGPDKYIRQINPVAGEIYVGMTFKQGAPLRVRVPTLKKFVEYAP